MTNEKIEELSDILDELQRIKYGMGDDTLVDVVEEHHFEHSLIDFHEPMDEYNSRELLPAIKIKHFNAPIPPDSGYFHKDKNN